MVEPPETPLLHLPKSASRGEGLIRYTVYGGKQRCDDCMELYTEHHRDGEPLPPPARMAKFERKQGSTVQLLCAEHKQLHQELEARR